MAKKDILLIGIIVVVLAALTYLIYDQVFSDKDPSNEIVSNTLEDDYEEDSDVYDYDDPYESEGDEDYEEKIEDLEEQIQKLINKYGKGEKEFDAKNENDEISNDFFRLKQENEELQNALIEILER